MNTRHKIYYLFRFRNSAFMKCKEVLHATTYAEAERIAVECHFIKGSKIWFITKKGYYVAHYLDGSQIVTYFISSSYSPYKALKEHPEYFISGACLEQNEVGRELSKLVEDIFSDN